MHTNEVIQNLKLSRYNNHIYFLKKEITSSLSVDTEKALNKNPTSLIQNKNKKYAKNEKYLPEFGKKKKVFKSQELTYYLVVRKLSFPNEKNVFS